MLRMLCARELAPKRAGDSAELAREFRLAHFRLAHFRLAHFRAELALERVGASGSELGS